MLDELRPLGLTDAAKSLGIDPFEVVRLLVLADAVPEQLRLTSDHVEKVRHVGGIEWWWEGGELPEDDNPSRAVVRGAFGQLLERDCVGARSTRLDNLWRGLGTQQAAVVQAAVTVAAQLGLVVLNASARGWQVAVNADKQEVLRKVVANEQVPDELSAVWQG